MKRSVEVFIAACPLCDPIVKLVQETSCDNCQVTVYNLTRQCEDKMILDKIKAYEINHIPSIVVNGKLLSCCTNKIRRSDLVNAGIGQM